MYMKVPVDVFIFYPESTAPPSSCMRTHAHTHMRTQMYAYLNIFVKINMLCMFAYPCFVVVEIPHTAS